MPIIPALILAINLAFPIYLWTRTSKDTAKITWPIFEKNLTRIVESDGGFPPCTSLQTVDVIHDLCQTALTQNSGVVAEQSTKHVVFSCTFNPESVTVGWHLKEDSHASLDCGDPGTVLIEHAPSFVFDLSGRIKTFEFYGEHGLRESIPYRNCRIKTLQLEQLGTNLDLDDFLHKLGRTQNDPEDFATANYMCLIFDSSPKWRALREKFLR